MGGWTPFSFLVAIVSLAALFVGKRTSLITGDYVTWGYQNVI